MRLIATCLVLFAASNAAGQVTYKEYYEGLPDLDALRPFASQRSADLARLRDLLSQAGPCEPQREKTAGARPICGPQADSIRELLAATAKGLPKGQFSGLWLAELEPGRGQALLVQFDVKEDKYQDRYAAFFAFQPRGKSYRVTAASWFLEGSLHAVQQFGPANQGIVFIRLLSCTACHPWIYLVTCDFVAESDGAAFEFSYALAEEQDYEPQIEYELPGMGHSIDAKVETRVPTHTPTGPHLLQYFDVEDGDDEWWSFTCDGLRCKPEVFTKKPPEWFLTAWSKASPL